MHNPEQWAAQDVPDLAVFKKEIILTFTEYFVNEDTEEVAACVGKARSGRVSAALTPRSSPPHSRATPRHPAPRRSRIRSLDSPVWHYEVVKRVITMAMDRANRERDLASRLISDLFGMGLLTSEEVGKGFERLFELADDLSLDTPDAYKLLAQFLARAVADETLPPSYLMDPTVKAIGGDIVADAIRLLSQKHSGTRLEHIFSSAHARTVAELKEEVRVMLEEYFAAQDVEEVRRCLQEMRSPFFHHEVVKRGIVLSFDRDAESRDAIVALLAELGREGVRRPPPEGRGSGGDGAARDSSALFARAGHFGQPGRAGHQPRSFGARRPLPRRPCRAGADDPSGGCPRGRQGAAAVVPRRVRLCGRGHGCQGPRPRD